MAQLPSQSQFGDYGEWPGRDVLDSDGERLGGVREIYLDRETGRPEWVLVDVEGHDDRFVPLADAAVEASTIRVAHSADEIRKAPGIGSEPRIDQSEERRLYEHYGLGYAEAGSGLPEALEPTGEDDAPPVVIPPSREESEEPATWSEAAAEEEPVVELAPLPAEPPSAAEIEAADIPEPPIARESEPEPEVEAEPEAEAAVEPEPAAQAEPEPEPEPDVVGPSAAGEILAAGAAAPEALAPEPDPPVLVPDPQAPAPGTPPRPDFAPPFAPPPPSEPPTGGAVETLKTRRGGIAAGVALAAVLFFVIRRLR